MCPPRAQGIYVHAKCNLPQHIVDGFVKEAANDNKIVMRERAAKDQHAGYETVLEYNIRKSEEDPLLCGAYLPTDPVVFANIGHCHNLQTGRAAIRELKWDMKFNPKLGIDVCDAEGRLSISALAAHSSCKGFKDLIEECQVRCKVLSPVS